MAEGNVLAPASLLNALQRRLQQRLELERQTDGITQREFAVGRAVLGDLLRRGVRDRLAVV